MGAYKENQEVTPTYDEITRKRLANNGDGAGCDKRLNRLGSSPEPWIEIENVDSGREVSLLIDKNNKQSEQNNGYNAEAENQDDGNADEDMPRIESLKFLSNEKRKSEKAIK